MKTITVAFDIDGTLRANTIEDKVVANERIRTLLIALASMKNTKIVVWSGGGELYAQQMVDALCIRKYVDVVAGKVLSNPASGKAMGTKTFYYGKPDEKGRRKVLFSIPLYTVTYNSEGSVWAEGNKRRTYYLPKWLWGRI